MAKNPTIKKVLQPKSDNQQDYLRSIAENQITLCTGPAGSGKSMLSCWMAANKLVEGEIKQILISRPLVGCGKGLGFLPGGVYEKTFDYFYPMYEYMEFFLGKDDAKKMLSDGIIKLVPLELMRGRTFLDTFMLLDEAQNCSTEQLKLFLTRVGHGSKMVISGDINQTDLYSYKDEGYSCDFDYVSDKLENIKNIGIVHLTTDDVFRSQIIKSILRALE